MKRLTKKNYTDDLFEKQKDLIQVDEHTSIHYSQADYNEDLWKAVKQKEDLEGKLKCSLDFVFKVLKAPKIYVEGMNVYSEYEKGFGFHARYNDYIINPYAIEGKRPEFLFIDRWAHGYNLRLKDYKKTWWLKADKSE